MTDQMGGSLLRPATLADFDATPDRVLTLYEFYRLGQAAREHPWDWMRPAGTRERAHQYAATPTGDPSPPARCGFRPDGEVVRWERTGGRHPCARCRAMDDADRDPARGRSDDDAGRIRFVAE